MTAGTNTYRSNVLRRAFSLYLFTLVIFSCNNPPSADAGAATDSLQPDTNQMRIQVPAQTCYRFASANDTVFLKVEKFPNVVTGVLNYTIKEKDKNTGDIDGVMKGDTLVAQYTFLSEGTQSKREVRFIIQNDQVTDLSTGYKLSKVPCETN